MKKKLIVLCAFILIQVLICSDVSFADDINETYEDNIHTEIEETIDDEIVSDVEEEIEEDIVLEVEEVTDEEILEDFEEEAEEDIIPEKEEKIVEEILIETEENVSQDFIEIIDETTTEEADESIENIVDTEPQEVVISTESECSDEEKIDDVYTDCEEKNIEDKIATPSTVSIKFNWLSDVCLDDAGMGGSYDANWKTFYVESGNKVEIPEEIALVLNYENCDQEYNLIGFTTNNQEEIYWLYADYAGGEKMYDISFIVDEDIELWAVYEAKYKYVSSINIDNENITYNYTTIPNLAIKDIKKIDCNDKNFVIDDEVCENYKFVEFGNEFIAYTKDAKYGQLLNEIDIKKLFY